MQEVPVEIRRRNNKDVVEVLHLLLALKERDLGGVLKCEKCEQTEGLLDFHHKRYGLDTGYHDLVYLCRKCHRKIH